MTDKELEIKIDKAIKDELTSNDGYMPFFPNSEFAVSLRNRLVKLFSIHDVSNRFVCDGRKRCKEQCEDCKYYN